jgi:prepilin-type N-terminal cleavage/methylation domain-containing protein
LKSPWLRAPEARGSKEEDTMRVSAGMRRDRVASAGFTMFELIIVVAVISLIAAITIPKLLDSRRMAQETSAIETCKVLYHAQISYFTKFGNYASSLDDLSTAGLAPAPFAVGQGTMQQKTGYEFGTCIPQDSAGLSDPSTNKSRFRICAQPAGADPTQRLSNGERAFFMPETGYMFEDTSIPDAMLGTAYTVIQSHPDVDFGTTYPAVPDF